MQRDRRAFLKRAMGAAGASLAVQLLAACAPTSTGPSSALPAAQPPGSPGHSAAPLVAQGLSTVSLGFASLNPSNLVPIVGSERPDLPARFGIGFDLVTTTNSPNALTALVGGSLDAAVVTPDAAWAAQDKVPELKQLFAVGNGTPYVLLAQPDIQRVADLKG